jgi:serine/threonine protein kinase
MPTPQYLADGTPARLGRYRLIRPISTGGMARVFEGRRESLAGVEPRVAIKVILPDYADNQPFQELFAHEAKVGSLLQHQNLVQVQDFDREAGRFYLVMEYVDGITLRRAVSLCRRNGIPLTLDLVAEIGRQVCNGLAHAHAARSPDGALLNLVHRDLKPSNLMLNPQGVVKLLDFGISKADFRPEAPGQVRGTWGYMSPEQADGEPIGGAADLFGLAAVLYELAASAPLFTEKDPDKVRPLLASDEAARRAARLGRDFAGLGGVLVRAMQRDPAARFTDASAMGRALAGLISDPVKAKEQLIRLQARLTQLNRPDAPERAVAPSAAGVGRLSEPSGPGLPIFVGDARGPARPAARSREQGPIEIDLKRLALPLFVLVALAVIAFTAQRLWTESSGPRVVPVDLQQLQSAASEEVRAVPTPSSEPPATVPVAAPPVAAPPVAAPPVAAPPPEPSSAQTAAGFGLLTVSSLPRSKVFVDGKFVRFTPLFRSQLPAGTHQVELRTEQGEVHRFTVEISQGKVINRVWSFNQGAWVGG